MFNSVWEFWAPEANRFRKLIFGPSLGDRDRGGTERWRVGGTRPKVAPRRLGLLIPKVAIFYWISVERGQFQGPWRFKISPPSNFRRFHPPLSRSPILFRLGLKLLNDPKSCFLLLRAFWDMQALSLLGTLLFGLWHALIREKLGRRSLLTHLSDSVRAGQDRELLQTDQHWSTSRSSVPCWRWGLVLRPNVGERRLTINLVSWQMQQNQRCIPGKPRRTEV